MNMEYQSSLLAVVTVLLMRRILLRIWVVLTRMFAVEFSLLSRLLPVVG